MDNLLETLKRACRFAYDRHDDGEGDEYAEALELLETPQALLTHLLTVEAAERVEVWDLAPGSSSRDWVRVEPGDPSRSSLRRFRLGNADARLRTLDGRQSLDYQISSVTAPEEIMNLILCLTAALAHQRKRDNGVGDV